MEDERTDSAFAGHTLIVSADVRTMSSADQAAPRPRRVPAGLIFEDQQLQADRLRFQGHVRVRRRTAWVASPLRDAETDGAVRTGPGRPRLGVVSREVSLLPRHWEWLEEQPGGMSVSLRKLVEEARKRTRGRTSRGGREMRRADSCGRWREPSASRRHRAPSLPRTTSASRTWSAGGLRTSASTWSDRSRSQSASRTRRAGVGLRGSGSDPRAPATTILGRTLVL